MNEKIYFGVAALAAVLTILAAAEPSFGRVAGAPIGLGILSAGFAIAAALKR